MDTIRYDFASIEASHMDISQSAAKLNGMLDDLKAYLNPLISSWEGDAAEAYKTQQLKWDQASAELNQVLDRVGVIVGQGNDAMNDTNRRAASSWM